MDKRLTRRCVSFAVVALVSALAAACAPSGRYEPIVRQPVPTLSDPLSPAQRPAEQGAIVVARGDSLYNLARAHGVPLRGLIEANRLRPPYFIQPGQRLRLPAAAWHVVREGETVYSIAQHYNTDMGSLVRINEIAPPYRIENGRRLRLPDGRAAVAPAERVVASASAVARPVPPPAEAAAAPPRTREAVVRPPPPELPPPVAPRHDSVPVGTPPPRSGRNFLWPVQGKVIVSFGARKGGLHNDGINIAAPMRTAIRAAENGVVAYVGNQLQGFGNLVLIKHSDGWMSAYAHSSELLVKRGDVVRRGQVIARVGRTGSVSVPQLHFELRKGERAVDPKLYLVRVATIGGRSRAISIAFRGVRPGPG